MKSQHETTDIPVDGVFVVIAAYNEASIVQKTILEVQQYAANIVLVDDGSTDDTSARLSGIHLVRHAINRGQGAALQTGISRALALGARIIVTFDADGQHPAHQLVELVTPIIEGDVDVVLGSRFLEHRNQIPSHRRILLQLAVFFTRAMTGMQVTDAHNGLRAFSRRAAIKIHLRQDRMAHASELLDQIAQLNFSHKEIPTQIVYTQYSQEKGQRAGAALRILWDYIIGRMTS